MPLKATLALALSLAFPAAALAQDTDIWLGHLDLSGGRVTITELVNITKRPGYDNQPAFFPDQRTLAYTVEAETMADGAISPLVVTENWLEELRQRVAKR